MVRSTKTEEKENTMKGYELQYAVFEVTSHLFDDETPTAAVTVYVRLNGSISKGAALNFIRKELEQKYKTTVIKFHFWANTTIGSSPSPWVLELTPDGHAYRRS